MYTNDLSAPHLVIGTRASPLARRQTELVAAALVAAWPALEIEMRVFSTRGDRESNRPLPEIGGKGLFTAELEAALVAGEISLAVHSLKDLPIAKPLCTDELTPLCIGAVLPRGDAHDVLVSRGRLPLADLPPRPRIGTSSPRRAAQILAVRPDAQIVPLRGNVETRLRRAASDEYDAIVLAAAGLDRLGLAEQVTETLPFGVMLPMPGQAALGVQCRADDAPILALLHPIHHPPTWAAVTAERAFLRALGGGCCAPVAAYADEVSLPGPDVSLLCLRGLVAAADGRQIVRVLGYGAHEEAERLGERLAAEALARGAAAILAETAGRSNCAPDAD